MEAILDNRTSWATERDLVRDHNARIRENYDRMLRPQINEEMGGYGYQENQYAPIETYNLIGNETVTYEQANRYFEPMMEEQTEQTQYYSAARSAADSEFLTSDAYMQAAMRKEEELRRLCEEQMNEYVPTTEQAKKAVNDAVRAVNRAKKAEKAAQGAVEMTAQREYYINLAKKAIVLFAVAFIVLVAVISFSSTLLNGMTVELLELQETLNSLQGQAETLRMAIAEEQSWESIYAYIQAHGLVLAG